MVHVVEMSLRLRAHFADLKLARMSSGTYCVIRNLGPVKGGKGMKHHEVLLTFSLRAVSTSIRAALSRRRQNAGAQVGESRMNETGWLENPGSS
jgi:hypothetical protein